MDLEFVRKRITELRMKKGVSEYKMSLDLGHSRSYIQSISSGRTMPSVQELMYICDYLEVSPAAFFDDKANDPILMQKAYEGMYALTDKDILILISLIERFRNENRD